MLLRKASPLPNLIDCFRASGGTYRSTGVQSGAIDEVLQDIARQGPGASCPSDDAGAYMGPINDRRHWLL